MIKKNFITKSMISFGAVVLITLSALFDIVSLVLIKNVFNSYSYNLIDLTKFKNLSLLLSNKSFLLGIFLFIISPIFFFVAIIQTDLTKAYPLNVSLKIIFNLLLAYIFLKEAISLKQIVGLILIIISVFLIL
tara:strand:- start:40 stop:438 length:399 start_codon:yes stop_codon:yes gene_type:complete